MQAAAARAVTAVAVHRAAAARVMIRIRAAQTAAAVCVPHVPLAVPMLTRAIEARACAATRGGVIRAAVAPAASGAVARQVAAIRAEAVVRAAIAAVAVHVRAEVITAVAVLAEAAVVRVAEAMAAEAMAVAAETAVTVRGRAAAGDKTRHFRKIHTRQIEFKGASCTLNPYSNKKKENDEQKRMVYRHNGFKQRMAVCTG